MGIEIAESLSSLRDATEELHKINKSIETTLIRIRAGYLLGDERLPEENLLQLKEYNKI